MHAARTIAAAAAALSLAVVPALATGGPVTAKAKDPNPCHQAHLHLLCPDLVMSRPGNLQLVHTPGGHVHLLSENRIENVGRGPAELFGVRHKLREMEAYQVIHTVHGHRHRYRTGGELYFYPVPGQGRYWKWHHAAEFQLWSLDKQGHRKQLVRTGPKHDYCLRDLEPSRRRPAGSPGHPIYPGCSQDGSIRHRRLGTSVGWADVYPATYEHNWIDVTGFRGCFAYIHVADPDHRIWERRENNNAGVRVIRLPYTGSARGCPHFRYGSST